MLLKPGFKFAEAAFEFPLLLRFFAGFEESRARRRRFRRAGRIRRARPQRSRENIRLAPQTRAGKKIVFEAGATICFRSA